MVNKTPTHTDTHTHACSTHMYACMHANTYTRDGSWPVRQDTAGVTKASKFEPRKPYVLGTLQPLAKRGTGCPGDAGGGERGPEGDLGQPPGWGGGSPGSGQLGVSPGVLRATGPAWGTPATDSGERACPESSLRGRGPLPDLRGGTSDCAPCRPRALEFLS